ncbi:MAG TPA: DNA-processing protein DprA [Actinomycetaceae bacterium]|nr:DNA-processing protein DprA [Actinomycetaceae bacterium]
MHLTGDDERMARIAWSRIAEPADPHAGETVARLGPVEALAWLRHHAGNRGSLGRVSRACVDRWAPRLETLDVERDLAAFERIGGRVIMPGDPEWPVQFRDLETLAPHVLWLRGVLPIPGSRHQEQERPGTSVVSVVGSRASTRYGETIAGELGYGLADSGCVVVSGGAYGIDAAAHRGALAAPEGAGTIAVLAGGADRFYPAGNAGLLAQIAERGLIVAEMPPGSSPARYRFLSRNRLIAALGRVTVVVEASHRSGALSTANHAADLLRPIGAVPGPVTSAASAGCHRLFREGKAVCVTGVEDVRELMSPAGSGISAEGPDVREGLLDGLDPLASRVFDALPARSAAEIDSLVRVSGLARLEVMAGLGSLELAGRVRRSGTRWARVTS